MIYRIAIYENGKFKRYATYEEMDLLRVNAKGNVEQLIYQEWLDVHNTHKVEWGMLTGDRNTGKLIPIYDGDIYVDWNTGIESKSSKPEVFDLLMCYNNLHPDQFPMIEVIGKIHLNPELLEG